MRVVFTWPKRSAPALLALMLTGVALTCAAAQSRGPQRQNVKVVGVTDGDTINVVDDKGQRHRIRLSGIDAPEKAQPFGERSRQSLAELTFGKNVEIEWSKKDPYGRLVAKVLVAPPSCKVPCTTRIDANLAQVEAGMAWFYRYYQNEQPKADRQSYAAAETRARQRKIGLWSQGQAVPPWDWRRDEAGRRRQKSQPGR
jgi:endonuclease YncB( thermonuclease family)